MSPLVTAPNSVLRQVASPVTNLDKKTLSIIEDMKTTLLAAKNPEGVGLAAPQIGVSLRIFIIRPTSSSKPMVFINPEIVKFSSRTQSPHSKTGIYEGCLSIPSHYAPLKRSMSITLKFQKSESPKSTHLVTNQQTFSGFPAHIIQHEMDHLNGILFIDRVLEQNTKLFRITGETWEEISL